MMDEPELTALDLLNDEVCRIRALIPNSRWFLFGSITTANRPIRDIDLLVVCEKSTDCEAIRSELASLCCDFPIHLLLMTRDEEDELKFIEEQLAVEVVCRA
jgi:hypothetical protein